MAGYARVRRTAMPPLMPGLRYLLEHNDHQFSGIFDDGSCTLLKRDER